jgi:hypothetical protein
MFYLAYTAGRQNASNNTKSKEHNDFHRIFTFYLHEIFRYFSLSSSEEKYDMPTKVSMNTGTISGSYKIKSGNAPTLCICRQKPDITYFLRETPIISRQEHEIR